MLYFEIILNKVGFGLIVPILYFSFLLCQIPDERIIAEWEPAMGTMIRWPLGIPSELVIELASENIIYVLVETNNQQNQAQNNFINWGIDMNNVVFISTDTYSHWTRDHGPQFLIGNGEFKVINQQFNGYPVESGCDYVELECDEEMILFDCIGTEFCNNQPEYASEGYDCYVNNDLCEDFNDDGQIMDWLGDGYCDDGNWGLDFMCNEYSFDCGDCEGAITDDNGYCNEALIVGAREYGDGRPLPSEHRGWNEDDDTNLDFANQMNWEIKNLPLYWTGGNFMTDGYGMGFSTQLMVNENNMSNEDFISMVNQYLNINDYHILENPNVESIQHIDCLAKLVDSETIIIKQVAESSPEYDCIEEFAESFQELNTFYDRPFEIHRILCPEISGGPWETNPVAAYTNSLILNDKIMVPQYGIVHDNQALQVYREAMPGYEVIGFDGASNNPWYAEDALHCRTMGIFDPNMMHISHKSIRTEEVLNNDEIDFFAEIMDYGNFELELESVILYWKYGAEDGPYGEIPLMNIMGNYYQGMFPSLNSNASVEYYIEAKNIFGKTARHPVFGWHEFYSNAIILGDLNGDGLINVSDIIITINIILGIQEINLSADMNADGFIDVTDVILLVNLIIS